MPKKSNCKPARTGAQRYRKLQQLPRGLAPFWMLNDASTVAEKLDYLRRCHAGGITALTLHPRAGNLIPFASREWFEMISAIVEEAARLGLTIWLYDEDPFPSGAAGGLVMTERPDLRARILTREVAPATLKPGDLWFIGPERILWAGLVPEQAGGSPVDLTDQVGPLRCDWCATELDSRGYYHETTLFYCVRGSAKNMQFALRVPPAKPGYKLIAISEGFRGVDGPWGSLPDLNNPATFPVYARLGLDPYVKAVGHHFGKTIPGIFTDEAKPYGPYPITIDLFDSFRQRFGYDLKPRLYQLFGDAVDDAALTARLDYRLWIRDRFLESFVNPYRDWCERHGLHFVGHFSPEDDPIDETFCLPAAMPVMKAMGLPGCDVIVPDVGDASNPTLNLGSLRVGSIKSQTGKGYATSESQALGEWVITSRKTRQIYAWQKVLGVDRFFTHGFFNSNDGIVNYEAPPDYGPNSSIFRGTCAVNEWLKASDALMDGGCEVAPVAILDNVFPYWTWSREADLTAMQEWRRTWWRTILHALQAHIGIHAVDTNDALAGTIEDGALLVGQRRYTTIVIPHAGLMEEAVFKHLAAAARAGVNLIWLGNGPERLATGRHHFKPTPALAGTILQSVAPSVAWYRRHLPRQLALGGPGATDCFVRRYRSTTGHDHLLVCNLTEEPRNLILPAEAEHHWNPVPGLVDGDLQRTPTRLQWEVPPMGSGFFQLGSPVPVGRLQTQRPLALPGVTFERLAPNTLRLDACCVTLKGQAPRDLPYPSPFWQSFDAYTATRSQNSIAGLLPLDSRVHESDLRYHFTFEAAAALSEVHLVLDPRALRGNFTIYHNGRRLSEALCFPLWHITPLKVPLKVRRGTNRLEFRFEIENAMEGILANLRLEGDFGVVLHAAKATLVKAARRLPFHPDGWLAMGLAHYMGDGCYRWNEEFTADEIAAGAWLLELAEVTDSATLRLNGLDHGTTAWAPWRWPLQGLKAGRNDFELTVSSTAGNLISLRYPAQPQGWRGGGNLLTHD